METIHDKLKNGLKPLYQKLLSENKFEDICAFCVQWGKNFPSENKSGILFVGRAVNGWPTEDTDIEVLFGDTNKKIFARDNQMEWVDELEGPNDTYNTNKSAFWRVVKKISKNLYPTEWYSYVAWSNLCKLAPKLQGNPSDALYYEQLESCQQILSKEIEILSPKVVVMLTSAWEKDFLYYLNGNKHPVSEVTIDWDKYQTKLYRIKGSIFIVSPHPQGKGEAKHVEAILGLMN